ncbi:hypothetical protein [Mycolicibacterium llatzerense]|uniref:hypothetical protein n=1 Tax=Mycolicibacterium llatzerense TaxID=280871 RepID=UPI0021B5D19A|nr:hypothetical protein [Mycolicibacterium llatzerense]MCT7367484.1 hypothetical protein [Mycolicibacterium llatzerense]
MSKWETQRQRRSFVIVALLVLVPLGSCGPVVLSWWLGGHRGAVVGVGVGVVVAVAVLVFTWIGYALLLGGDGTAADDDRRWLRSRRPGPKPVPVFELQGWYVFDDGSHSATVTSRVEAVTRPSRAEAEAILTAAAESAQRQFRGEVCAFHFVAIEIDGRPV